MKLHYNILWFEDRVDFVNEDIGPQLKEYLEELGIVLSIDLKDRYVASAPPNYAQYDLIICDLNLPGATPSENTGRTIVKAVRDFKVYTEVILYSEDAALLKKQLKALGLVERASFHAKRKDMFQKVVKIIDLTIRKVQTVNNARGLVIAETIDLETKMERVLVAYFKPSGDATLDGIKVGRIEKFLKNKSKFIKKNLERVEAYNAKQLEEFCEQKFIATFDFIQLLIGIVGDTLKRVKTKPNVPAEQVKTIETLAEEFSSIEDEVNDIRNTLAHVKEEHQADGTIVLTSRRSNGKPIVFNDGWCKAVRKSLHKHSKNLDEIQKALAL